ncbi:MAG: hypothetical protein ACXAEX_19930, partial [Promethearchaeota archaeon]
MSRSREQYHSENDTKKHGRRLSRLLKQIKKEYRLFWTDKFNLLIAIVVPPLVILLLGFMMNSIPDVANPIECIVISYDSNAFIPENNFTESRMD